MKDDYHNLSIQELGNLLRQKEVTSLEITMNMLKRIEKYNPVLHAYTNVCHEIAIESAKKADSNFARKIDVGPLQGIPYAVKNIFDVAGLPTTCHSKIMLDKISSINSSIQEKISKAGGVLLGTLASHEFALGGPSYELPFPPAVNPWNTECFTGASSSGAGAAVAARLAHFAIGSDTSGSIRNPAGLCGVFGFKPTYGMVSRYGAFPLSYSLDHMGPLTTDIKNIFHIMSVITGYDPKDPSTIRYNASNFKRINKVKVSNLKFAFPINFIEKEKNIDEEILTGIYDFIGVLRNAGASVEEVILPDFDVFNACGRIIMAAESFLIHKNNILKRPLDFAKYTYQRVFPGIAISSTDLLKAYQLRGQLTKLFNLKILKNHDAMICANSLVKAAKLASFPKHWPPASSIVSGHTIPFNITGNPALAIPISLSSDGLPIGLQLVGKPYQDLELLQIALTFDELFFKNKFSPIEFI